VIGDEHLRQQRSDHEEPRHEMTIETADQFCDFPHRSNVGRDVDGCGTPDDWRAQSYNRLPKVAISLFVLLRLVVFGVCQHHHSRRMHCSLPYRLNDIAGAT
jgi:hypothetical protein